MVLGEGREGWGLWISVIAELVYLSNNAGLQIRQQIYNLLRCGLRIHTIEALLQVDFRQGDSFNSGISAGGP